MRSKCISEKDPNLYREETPAMTGASILLCLELELKICHGSDHKEN